MLTKKANEKGLTLIEALISLVIVSTALVFVLNALAKVAEAQKEAEIRSAAYEFMVMKLAELEQRVQPRAEIKDAVKGYFRARDLKYDWELSSGVLGASAPEEEGGSAEEAAGPLLLSRDLEVSWKRGGEQQALGFSTLSLIPAPKAET